MTEQPKFPRQLTPNQLRAVVYNIARTYLEVERGLRPPEQLEAFLTKGEYHRHRISRRGQLGASGPVRPTDIGRIHLETTTPERVNASMLVRRDDDRWSALVVDLRQIGRGWRVDRLDRLERIVPRIPRHVAIDEHAVDHRRDIIERDREHIQAAYDAAVERYEQLPDKRRSEARSLRDERDRWAERLHTLHDEVALLEQTGAVEVPAASESLEQDADGRASRANTWLLGPRPPEAQGARAWDQAQRKLAAYEARWSPDSPPDLLRAADDANQESDRRNLLRILAQSRHAMQGSVALPQAHGQIVHEAGAPDLECR